MGMTPSVETMGHLLMAQQRFTTEAIPTTTTLLIVIGIQLALGADTLPSLEVAVKGMMKVMLQVIFLAIFL